MPAPVTIQVPLTQAETDYIWNFVQSEYPSLTAQQVIAILTDAGKEGIVAFVKDEVRKKMRTARQIEEDNLRDAFHPPVETATPEQ